MNICSCPFWNQKSPKREEARARRRPTDPGGDTLAQGHPPDADRPRKAISTQRCKQTDKCTNEQIHENNEKLYDRVFVSVTCSGTASLEISKRLIPQIVFYKLNFLTYFIFSYLVSVIFANILNILSNKMIIKEVVNRYLNKKNLLEAFDILLNDQNFRDNQILEIQKFLPEIQSKTNPYDVCEKRITEIISTTT